MKRITPIQLITLTFLCLISLGTVGLSLPGSTVQGHIPLVDALFTATSAVCVTGLIVVDTGSFFTLQGKLIILFLIQAGALGIVSFSGWFFLLIRKRFSLVGREALQKSFLEAGQARLHRLILGIFLFTIALEVLGTLLLFILFLPYRPPGEALFSALFHSVSAFCNAGFSLFPDSLVRFQQNVGVNLVVIGLIVSGGIGFIVLSELRGALKGGLLSGRRMTLHSKLALSSTLILILSGTLLFFSLESFNLFRELPIHKRILPSLFQSVTTRTAGFNTISIEGLTNGSLFFTIILMAIGGCPGSTAGGIKATTVAILFVLLLSRLRGRRTTEILKRTLPEDLVSKALATAVAFIGVTLLLTLLLQFTELGRAPHGEVRGRFLELLFETVSAMGTVGLSTGFTAKLSVLGRLVVVLAMFTGRLGPLALALSFVGERPSPAYSYPEERVMIG